MTVLKILKDGETDIDSTDISKFVMHTKYPAQIIYSSGQTTMTILNGNKSGEISVNHSLDYAPTVIASFESTGSKFSKVGGLTPSIRPDGEDCFYRTETTDSSVKFICSPLSFGTLPVSGDLDIDIYYIILYEEI